MTKKSDANMIPQYRHGRRLIMGNQGGATFIGIVVRMMQNKLGQSTKSL